MNIVENIEEKKISDDKDADIYKTSRFLYILEAAFEYFISLAVTGAYLAKVSAAIGLNDALTGILSSFVSLGCSFQLVAIFLANKRPVKKWVTVLHTLNQLSFALIYLVPFIKVTTTAKIAIFITFLLIGHILNNVVYSPKINWFMSLVDDDKRGRFTANKEIVSLIGSMIFSFSLGFVIDYFEQINNRDGAFIVCGLVVFGLMLSHSATLIFAKEKPVEETEKIPTTRLVRELLKDKTLLKVILVSVLWNVVNYMATPFYGSYQINELGFSMTFVSALTAVNAIVRSCVSQPMGRFADKYSFAKTLNICFLIMLVGFCCNVFAVPANGKILYTAYFILQAIALSGINSASINLIYDYVDKEKRIGALALKGSLAGIAGFLTTVLVSPLVEFIQNNGNTFLGMNVYAQQVLSAISALLLVGLILYLNLVVRRIRTEKR